MPPKKQKAQLSLTSTESEPSHAQAKPATPKKTRSKKELPSSKADKSAAKPSRPAHVPKEWGAPGEGGYFAFQKEYLLDQQGTLGEKFNRKDGMKSASGAWKEKDPQWKWQQFGAAPPAPKAVSEYPSGNFLKFQAEFRQKMKDAGKEEGEKKEWNVAAKAKWDTMSDKEKSAYAIILTEEQKAERAAKREEKKAKKAAEKVEEKKQKRAKSAKAAKSSKVEPGDGADSDKQPQRKKSATPKKTKKVTATKKSAASELSEGSKSGEDSEEGMTATEAQYKEAWEKHADLDGFDVPIRQLMPEKKLKATTFAKAMKDLKVALVVNTASKCGNTKKHFREMVELQDRFGEMGFSVLAFPSASFGQEPLKAKEIRAWAEEHHGANFPMFEPILVNGQATHPIYQRLKEEVRGGKGLDNIKFNYDKFLVAAAKKGEVTIMDHATSKKKPAEYADEIELLLK